MPRGARLKSRSGIYHVMLRGANKQEIFHDDEDCAIFLKTLERYKEKSGVSVYAWCLMNNHVHLLLKEGNEELSNTMKRIGVSYVWYYNGKYKTTGHLFQDRFKSENVESFRYFVTVIRYIHQNPMKAGMVNQVSDWRWSSCHEYYGGENKGTSHFVDCEFVLKMISPDLTFAKEKFQKFNERNNRDTCLEVEGNEKRRITDNQARAEVVNVLGTIEIAQVKSLPKSERNEVVRKIKEIEGISQRQIARIVGVSVNLVFKA